MKFPNKSSQTFFVLQSLYESGPQGYNDLQTKFENLSRSTLTTMAGIYGLHFDGKAYSLPAYLQKWFQDMQPAAPKVLGEIVPSRTVKPFTEMNLQAYGASLKAGRNLREISYMNASR